MYFIFFKYILHVIKNKKQPQPSGAQAVKLLCTDGTRKTSFMVLQCHKEKKLKVAQKYQKHMLFMKSILQKPSHPHELAFAHPH